MRNHLLRAAAGTAAASSGGGGSAAYVTDDLVFHIDAGNSSSYSGSGTTVNSLVGSITSSSFDSDISYSSSVGGCFDFTDNATGHGIVFDASSFMPLGSNSVTFEMWYLAENNYNIPFALFRLDGSNYRATIQMYERYTTRFSVYKEKASEYLHEVHSGNNTMPEDTWHHAVASFDTSSATLTMYLNGSQVATGTNSSHLSSFHHESTDSAYQINIGGHPQATYFDLEGYVSIARIYKGRALSASEVTQNYNAEKARHGY